MKESKLGTREKLFSKNAIARNIKDGKKMAKKQLDPYAREKYLRKRSGADDNILWNDLDYMTADKMYFMHKCGNTQAAQCRKYIIDFLGTELSFKQTDESIYPKGDFKEIVMSEWAKFITEAYDSIFITGVCPIEFTRSAIDNVEFVPSVLNYQSVRIQVAYLIEINDLIFRILRPSKYFQNIEESTTAELGMKAGGSQNEGFSGLTATFMNHFDIFEYGKTLQKSGFEFLSNRMGDNFASNVYGRDIPGGWVLDRCAIVLHDFGYNPDIYGRLTTPLQSIIDLKESTALNLSLMNGGAIQNSAMPLFIQSTEQTDSQADKAIVSFEAAANQRAKTKHEKTEENMKAMEALSDRYYGRNNEYHLGSISSINGSMMKRIASSGPQDYITNINVPPPIPIIPITPGYVLSGGQKRDPTIGHRFFDLDEMLRNDISSAYGIPRELLQNTGTHSQNTAVQAEFFQKTVMGWALIFKRLLTFVYNSIYGKTDQHFRITTILERRRISNDMAKRIEDDIIDDWNEVGGNMTRREKESENYVVETESEEDSEESEEEPVRSKKRDREESPEKEGKTAKKKRPHAFDPDIQSKVNSNVGQNFPKENEGPLENVDLNKPIEVSLSLKSVASIDLLSYMHIQNAITHDEFWIAMRQQIGYSIDDKSLKKLKQQMKEMAELENPQKDKSGASSGKAGAGSKSKSKSTSKSSKKPASTQDVSMEKTLKTISKSVTQSVMKSLMSESGMEASTSEGSTGEGKGRKKDHEKARKDKIKSSYKNAKESNIKRSISARGTQVANAKKGKKNKEKKGI
jgi:hypothetical protein